MKWQPTQWINSLIKFVIFAFDNAEHLLIVIVSRLAPWAAPLAPAYFVADTIRRHFDAPWWVSVAVGVTVEAVGIASTHITLEMYTYNQGKRKTDPEAPVYIGIIVAAIYFITGVILTIVLEVWPQAVIIAPAFFFLLAALAYITLALMSDHAKRLHGVAEQKAEQKRNRIGTEVPERNTGNYADVSNTTREQARSILAERPGISGTELALLLGKSDSLGRRLKRELRPESGNNFNHNGTGK